MLLVTDSFLLHIPHILQVIFLSIMPALWIAHENKTKKDATLIHTTLASALNVHLIKKKDVPLEMQLTISDRSGGEPIYVVAKDDIELAKILMFLDVITSIARKKFGSRARVEDVVPAKVRLFTIREDLRLKHEKKYREKKLRERNKKPLTLEDIINSEDMLNTIATKIASSAKQKVSVKEIKQMIKEYIPYIKKITDAYPDDPAFYDKIMRIPGLPDVERDIKPLNPNLYRAIEDLAEKLKKGEKATEHKDERKTSPSLDPNVKVEVLSILQALEFADYSEKAKEKALQKLSERISELSKKEPTRENLLKLGLYFYAFELIKNNRWENIKKLQGL